MYFTTTRLHQELAGAHLPRRDRRRGPRPDRPAPVQGQRRPGQARGPHRRGRRGEDPVRVAGGHGQHGRRPAGLDGQRPRAPRAAATATGIRVLLDATRMVENALFIQEREEGYAGRSIAEILLEFCSYTDGAWMSAKKDNLVNIGGWLAVNDADVFEELRNLVVVYEGLHTYGGMAGRDMEALAIGIEEAVQDEHVRAPRRPGALPRRAADRVGHPDRAADRRARDLPRRASASIRTSRRTVFPAQTLAARALPRLRDPLDGARDRLGRARPGDRRPQAPEARADPAHDPAPRLHAGAHGRRRRVGEGLLRRAGRRDAACRMVYEPKYLRFFQARFEPIA